MRKGKAAYKGLKGEPCPPERDDVMSKEVKMREGQTEQCADNDHLSMAAKRNSKGSAGFVSGTDFCDQLCNGDD